MFEEGPSTWAEVPVGEEESTALICIDMNRSALFLLAISARSFKGMNLSVVLVYITFTSGYAAFILFPTCLAIDRVRFFS